MKSNNKLDWYNSHKDDSPINTIQKIRSILSEINILPIEKGLTDIYDDFYSVRIVTSIFGETIGQNGKGISAEFALASGYSELIERLQNLFLFKKRFGVMNDITIKRLGSKMLPLKEIMLENEEFFQSITNKDLSKINSINISEIVECIPYYNVTKDKVCYLPEFLFSFSGSNGMCAGNTPEEAIAQGICEIFERYSIRYIYENKLDIPTIPLEELRNLSIYQRIQDIQSMGYNVMVKDCTLEGKFPVLAVIIFNREQNKCLVNFGSDPIFEVALMRCLTESFQGFDEKNEQKMYSFDIYKEDVSINFKKCIDDFQICEILPKLIASVSTPNYKGAFLSEYENSQTTLSFVNNILSKNNYELYINDVSFLGYPSYHIYIPWLSEYYSFDNFKYSKLVYPAIKVLLNLPKATDKELEDCVDRVEKYLDNSFNKFVYTPDYGRFLKDLTGIIINRNECDFNFSIDYLLVLLNIKLRRYEKAYYWLNEFFENLESIGLKLQNAKYYQCVCVALKLRVEDNDIDDIKLTLNNMFGESISQDVLRIFINPENILSNYELPTCGNCQDCKIKRNCFYEEWKDMAKTLNKRISSCSIKQENLSKYFYKTE